MNVLSPDQIAEAAWLDVMREPLADLEHLQGKLADAKRSAGRLWTFFWLSLLGTVAVALMPRSILNSELVSLIVGFVLFTIFVVAINSSMSLRRRAGELEAFEPGRKIVGIRYGLLPICTHETGSGNYLIDMSGLGEPLSITFPSFTAMEELDEILSAHRRLVKEMPVVLSSDERGVVQVGGEAQTLYSEESALHDAHARARAALDRLESTTESVHLLSLEEWQVKKLVELDEVAREHWGEAKDVSLLADRVEQKVREIIGRLEGELDAFVDEESERNQVEEFLDRFVDTMQGGVETLSANRTTSLSNVLPSYACELQKFSLMASYNCYCPSCNAEALSASASGDWAQGDGSYPSFDAATRMRAVSGTDLWECPVCGGTSSTPIPVHRLLDELVYPTMDRLYQENRVERSKLYIETEEKKRALVLDAEREIRSLVDGSEKEVRCIQTNIRGVASEVEAARTTVTLLSDQLGHLEALRETNLQRLSDELKETIDSISKYREHTLVSFERTVGDIVESTGREFDRLAKVARQEDEARMAIQKEIATKVAESTMIQKSQLEVQKQQAATQSMQLTEQRRQTEIQKGQAEIQARQLREQQKQTEVQKQQVQNQKEQIGVAKAGLFLQKYQCHMMKVGQKETRNFRKKVVPR